jgi:hypothetical protein
MILGGKDICPIERKKKKKKKRMKGTRIFIDRVAGLIL